VKTPVVGTVFTKAISKKFTCWCLIDVMKQHSAATATMQPHSMRLWVRPEHLLIIFGVILVVGQSWPPWKKSKKIILNNLRQERARKQQNIRNQYPDTGGRR
jgi:hypothetical protein